MKTNDIIEIEDFISVDRAAGMFGVTRNGVLHMILVDKFAPDEVRRLVQGNDRSVLMLKKSAVENLVAQRMAAAASMYGQDRDEELAVTRS